MRTSALILLIIASIATLHASGKWSLVWSDEFDRVGAPDPAKWSYEIGANGWGNQELQYYTKQRPENARVEKGHLIIEARKESYKDTETAGEYTSARLVTKGKAEWKYGRIEVRAKLPHGRGTWPAIWMLASKTPLEWPDDGEIDIMEHVGHNPGQIHASIHCKKYNHIINTQKTAVTQVPDCSDAFHVYSLEWDAEAIAISVDGKEYFCAKNEHTGYETWPFDQPFYLILNIAVGGFWGGAKGVDETIWPQRMEIDYVRVYQRK